MNKKNFKTFSHRYASISENSKKNYFIQYKFLKNIEMILIFYLLL